MYGILANVTIPAKTQNVNDVIKLISSCGGNELKTPLLSSPNNVLYTSPLYVSKFIGVIDNYLKLPLLMLLQEKHFTFVTDETLVGVRKGIQSIAWC